MTNPILNPEIQCFINDNIGKDVSKMALQKNPVIANPEVSGEAISNEIWHEILNQITAKRKAKIKLPSYFATENIIYPNKISVEQTSSEKTAEYKASIISGNSLIDLTGGFGVDCFYFSKKINQIVHCELNKELSQIAKHNFAQLKVNNIHSHIGDSAAILENLNQKFDWIYIDPSRRNDAKGKVFMLKDCLPNVPELLDFYFKFSNNLLIKTAPILDITAGLQELKNIKTIHIIAIDNEVKELLWEIEKGFVEIPYIKTINISKKIDIFASYFNIFSEKSEYCLPQKYLYEPNAAVMKSGLFDEIGIQYNLKKIHQHSHLYTNNNQIEFCGRVFVIEKCFQYNKQEMKLHLENKKVNITTRNFPETVENIRKKWKIAAGGNQYCFFTTNRNNEKIVLICNQIFI